MKKAYLYIAALVLAVILIDVYFSKILPKGVVYALGAALGYVIGAILWNAIKNRKKE